MLSAGSGAAGAPPCCQRHNASSIAPPTPQASGELVATSRQLGFREDMSRAKVQTSVTCRTALMSPSMTLPALSRIAVTSSLTKRTVTWAMRPAEIRVDDAGRSDADEAELVRLAARLALGNDGVEAIEDLAREKPAQRVAVAARIGRHDRLVGDLCAVQEGGRLECGVGRRDCAQRLKRAAVLGQGAETVGRRSRRKRAPPAGAVSARGIGTTLLSRAAGRLASSIGIEPRPIVFRPPSKHAPQPQENCNGNRHQQKICEVKDIAHRQSRRS